ncbi:MAG: efflux RND transporter permease subunit [Thermoguttaceae bacterium]
MNQLAALCVRRPVFATVLILVLVVFGVFGYTKLGLDRFPKVDFPIITVTTREPGSAPEDIETQITDKIEEAVNTINGIEELRSVSSEGISQVFIQFKLEKDGDVAAQDVRDKVNGVLPDLPKDIQQPTVEKLDPDATPILSIAVSAPPPTTIRDITEYCDKVLRRQLETVSGVGQAMLVGGQARQINVQLDPMKLRAYKLTVADVAHALESQNVQMPSGAMKIGSTEYTLRTLGRVHSMKEMDAITVANRDGRTITIGDLGHCEDSTKELESASLYNDTTCVLLNVRKQSGTNTVEVANQLKERLESLRSTMPKGYEVKVVRDQSIFIQAAVDTVEHHLLIGGALAAVIVFFFLANVRATLIAALAIPTSIIAAFAIVQYMGFTLNSLTLLALTLSVGIVIDDAIVVMENIFRYIEEKKYSPYEAAIAATGEIGLAVMAITISLIAVFLPIAMMEGIVGRFLKSFGVTMAATILVSMLVSFTLTPMLAARWFKKSEDDDDSPRPLAGEGRGVRAGGDGGERSQHDALTLALSQREREQIDSPRLLGEGPEVKAGGSKGQVFYRAIESVYLVLLRFSLRHRWLIVLATIGCMATLPMLFRILPKNFVPDEDSSEFQLSVQAPEGTTLEETQVVIARIARDIHTLNGVRYTISSVADTDQRNPYQGTIYVRLVNIADREYGQLEMMDFVRKKILPKPEYVKENLRISVTPVSFISGGGMSAANVQYMIGGPDMNKLEQYATAVMKDLREVPGAVDVDSSLSAGKPQYGMQIDRPKAAELHVNVADISNTLRLLVAGDKVSDYTDRGEQYEVHVRAIADARNRLDNLKMITVPSDKFGTVPLDDVVRIVPGTGPAQIDRLGRTRQVTISANTTPGTSEQGILDAIDQATKNLNMGPEYKTGFLGKSKEMAKAFRAFFLAFILAFIFVYLCIAAQFESWLHPITILLSLPLTLPFALLSLFLFRQSINIFSLLGILVLFAVVKKNSILQIDHANQLRAGGMPKFEAIVQANRDRLRPILMTTVAFVAGMIPTLVSNAEGAAVNKAISGVIVGGQTLSLLLTLLAVPVAYSLFDDLSVLAARLFGRRQAEPDSQPPDGQARTRSDGEGGNGHTVNLNLDRETILVRREPSRHS